MSFLFCPCHSGKFYNMCCEPFHTGKMLPETALQLMRSRYSAYAKNISAYLIQTTHPKNELFKQTNKQIEANILDRANATEFKGLEIIEFIDGDQEAYVTFKAHLIQNGQDASFQEKSCFFKVSGKWLYHSGILLEC